jgi:hypothetical protein
MVALMNGSLTDLDPLAIVKSWYATCDPSLLSEDFSCHAFGYGTKRSTYSGPDGMLSDFFGDIQSRYDEWSLRVDRYIDSDTSVTVLGFYSAKLKAGQPEEIPFAHVWDISEAGEIKSVTCFTETKRAA